MDVYLSAPGIDRLLKFTIFEIFNRIGEFVFLEFPQKQTFQTIQKGIRLGLFLGTFGKVFILKILGKDTNLQRHFVHYQ